MLTKQKIVASFISLATTMAETVRFELTNGCPLPDFESGPLWPLRYRSLYAQPLFFLAFFRWKKALERTDGKNSKLIQFSNRVKPAWLQGSGWTKRTAPRKISSQPRYDHFDTSPCINIQFCCKSSDQGLCLLRSSLKQLLLLYMITGECQHIFSWLRRTAAILQRNSFLAAAYVLVNWV